MTMPPPPMVKPPEEITKEVPLAFRLPGEERIKIADFCPLTGKIVSISMTFDECNGLVHVAFGHSDKWVSPSEINTFISLSSTTRVVPGLSEPVVKNEHLWAEIRNGDVLPHTISVIATIIGRDS
ncbi:unnamed protein product [marine sediment metagenome]|uniref:Uncharacterized protein n=1 Tax=marine sediment metagenome TaxID=412755 RepID=X1UDD5_9ZZZZ